MKLKQYINDDNDLDHIGKRLYWSELNKKLNNRFYSEFQQFATGKIAVMPKLHFTISAMKNVDENGNITWPKVGEDIGHINFSFRFDTYNYDYSFGDENKINNMYSKVWEVVSEFFETQYGWTMFSADDEDAIKQFIAQVQIEVPYISECFE